MEGSYAVSVEPNFEFQPRLSLIQTKPDSPFDQTQKLTKS